MLGAAPGASLGRFPLPGRGDVASKERRKEPRMGLALPVRVQGFEMDGKSWEEMTTSEDASYSGCAFTLKHPVGQGQALHLSLPLPKHFRQYDISDPSYHVYALVRDVTPGKGTTRAGTLFLGKQPPRGFGNPASRFLMPNDPKPAARERRAHQRLDVFLNLRLRRQSEGAGPQEEKTVSENLSRRGARVLTSLAVARGDVLDVEELQGTFRSRAEIRNVYIGKDNIPRLNLCFLDADVPERLILAS